MVATHVPEIAQRRGQTHAQFGARAGRRPTQRRAQIVVLDFQVGCQCGLIRTMQPRLDPIGFIKKEGQMAVTNLGIVSARQEAACSILPNGLEHSETGLARWIVGDVSHKAAFDQRQHELTQIGAGRK
jgi:hypothetical protein